MNRIQFFILIGLSSVVILLLAGNILLARSVFIQQSLVSNAQQALNQGQGIQQNLGQLARRVYADAQKTQDQGLKDLLTRQQITFKANDSTNSTDTPAAPSSTH